MTEETFSTLMPACLPADCVVSTAAQLYYTYLPTTSTALDKKKKKKTSSRHVIHTVHKYI